MPAMPPEMPMPMPEEGAMPPMPEEMPPMPEPAAAAGDPAAALDQILATGAASGAEILAALEGQGFMITEGTPAMEEPMPEEMPLEEEMPMEEPMPEEMDLLSAARAGMEEDERKKAALSGPM